MAGMSSGQSRRDVLSVVISGIANRNPVGVTLTHKRRALRMKRGHSYTEFTLLRRWFNPVGAEPPTAVGGIREEKKGPAFVG